MTRASDYAVVIGIGQYPDFAREGAVKNLEGPDNDAQAVFDWLVADDGGALPEANVKMFSSTSPKFQPPDPDDPQPAAAFVERQLTWLATQTQQRAGDRLYLYFSGHGYSPVLDEGALFTAEATLERPSNVYIHDWMRWFRNQGRFRETVLWMDACMNPARNAIARPADLANRGASGAPGPLMVGLAAQTRSALELRMPDDKVHGVFTWTLLQGLRGGAADERATITAESLKTFLHNTMQEFLPEEVRQVSAYDLVPYIRAEPGMVFRTLPSIPTFAVRLTVPRAVSGQQLTIWSGRPHVPAVSAPLQCSRWEGELPRGLYVAEVADLGLRQGFQVSGGGVTEIDLVVTGDRVRPSRPQDLFTLTVSPQNPGASITVVNHAFERTAKGTGEVSTREQPGVYKVRVELGRDITSGTDEIVVLDRDTVVSPAGAGVLVSPAPIPGTGATHEYHEDAYRAASQAFPGSASGLSVIARYWTDSYVTDSVDPPHPMAGLALYDEADGFVASLVEGCRIERTTQSDPIAVWRRELPPGTYYLEQTLAQGSYAGSLVVQDGWVTQLALQRTTGVAAPSGDNQSPPDDAALFMRAAADTATTPEHDTAIEAARVALVQGRNLFTGNQGSRLADVLFGAAADPMARIIGAHLLLRAMKDQSPPDPVQQASFDQAVSTLRESLGEQADVVALSLSCSDPQLRLAGPVATPPMFKESWRLLTEASYDVQGLIAERVWQRVQAPSSLGSFLVWATDGPAMAGYASEVSDWVTRSVEHENASTRSSPGGPEAIVSMGLPGPGASSPAVDDDAEDVAYAGAVVAPSGNAVEKLLWAGARRVGIPAGLIEQATAKLPREDP